MMSQLQKAGVLNHLSGFVFGQCVSYGPSSGSASMLGSESLDHYIKPLKSPAWSGAMIGHMPQMWTLPEGVIVRIDAKTGKVKMLQSVVN